MDNIKQTVADAVNKVEEVVGVKKPVETVPETSPDVVKEPEIVAAVQTPVIEEPKVEEAKDPTLNCPDCGGTGLKDDYNKCATCLGKGKVS